MALAVAYAGFTAFARVVCLSLVTFMATRTATKVPTFSEIAETFAAFEILSAATVAIVFVYLLRWKFPVWSEGASELLNSKRIEARFLPGFLTGATLATAWTFCFVFLGQYEYVGWYLQFEDSSLGLLMILVRALSLIAWVYCEEFIFRRKILRDSVSALGSDWRDSIAAVVATTLVFISVKQLQFDLGWTYIFNLALLSMILSLRMLSTDDFVQGAAYVIGLYVVFNPVAGLPLLGSEFSGFLSVKPLDHPDEWIRRLIGGNGGPFSGFGITVLLAIELARVTIRFKHLRRSPEPW